MRKEGKASNIIITVVIAVAVIAICVFFKIKSRDTLKQSVNDDRKIQELESEIEAEKERTETLDMYAKYVNTKQFVELMARNKLGLVYPNEIIFKDEE